MAVITDWFAALAGNVGAGMVATILLSGFPDAAAVRAELPPTAKINLNVAGNPSSSLSRCKWPPKRHAWDSRSLLRR